MKEGWKYVKFKEAGTFISGYTPKKDELKVLGSIPYFKVAEMNLPGNERFLQHTNLFVDNARKTIPANSIVFPKNGGAIYTEKKRILSFDSIIDLNTEAIVPNENVALRDFIFYFLSFIKISSFDNGGGLPSVNITKMADSKIPVPPLSEQQQIVDFLDAEFAKIDELKNQAEQSLQNAKDLFQAALKEMLTPKEGWKMVTLPEISDNLDSKRIPVTKGKRDEGKYPYYGASGIVDYVGDYIFDEDLLLISEDGANLLARTYPIAFSVSGKIWVNNHAHVLKFSDLTTQRFVEYYFASIDISDYVTGAAQPKFAQKKMNILPIPYPSIEEQKVVVETLELIEKKIQQLQSNYTRTIQLCADLKQALLRQVFE